MNEKPILFSTPMVKAILEGRKSQTRRVLKNPGYSDKAWLSGVPHNTNETGYKVGYLKVPYDELKDMIGDRLCCKYEVGDRLWVRETFLDSYAIGGEDENGNPINIIYKASYDKHPNDCFNWKPSIFMFREYSRINLEVTEVRVQRLEDLTEDNAMAEGFEADEISPQCITARCRFAQLWDKLNEKRGYPWGSNAWVWAISFKKV